MDLYLGLGSNLGDRLKNIENAKKELKTLIFESEVISSKFYQSKALLLPNSPKEWDLDFYNIIIKGECSKAPQEILNIIKGIEIKLGRQKSQLKWSPRIIDIDIIAYSNIVIETENCLIPHKEMLNRDFVMFPLAEIAPNYHYPLKGNFYNKTIAKILDELILLGKFEDIY